MWHEGQDYGTKERYAKSRHRGEDGGTNEKAAAQGRGLSRKEGDGGAKERNGGVMERDGGSREKDGSLSKRDGGASETNGDERERNAVGKREWRCAQKGRGVMGEGKRCE